MPVVNNRSNLNPASAPDLNAKGSAVDRLEAGRAHSPKEDLFAGNVSEKLVSVRGLQFKEVTIKPGDTIWDLAKQHLGNAGNHNLITDSTKAHLRKDFDPAHLKIGDKVLIPVSAQERNNAGLTSERATHPVVTIANHKYLAVPLAQGDSIYKLAERHCDKASRHLDIQKVNTQLQPNFNPNKLHVGQVIYIPMEMTRYDSAPRAASATPTPATIRAALPSHAPAATPAHTQAKASEPVKRQASGCYVAPCSPVLASYENDKLAGLAKQLASQGTANLNCGAGVCNILSSYFKGTGIPQSSKIWDQSQPEYNKENVEPGQRHAYRINNVLERLSQQPEKTGWVKLPINNALEAPNGSIICYPSSAGYGERGAGRGSNTYGHIEIVSRDQNNNVFFCYDGLKTNFGGRAETRERFAEACSSSSAYCYAYIGPEKAAQIAPTTLAQR